MANPTFSPELLAAIIEQVNKTMAAKKSMPAVAADTGKSAKSLANEKAAKIAFKKAGFGNVTPHEDVRTFNRWMAAGFRPMEGSKSLKVKNLRLFHRSQVRELTIEEKQAMQKQSDDAIARHNETNKVDDNVVTFENNPQ